MTTNELMEFCRNLALLRTLRDSDLPMSEASAIELQERLRAGRGRVQDAYRKVKDRLEAVLDYGRVALGEEEFEAARREVDDAPAPEPKKRGRPKKDDADLPGQQDLFAHGAAEEARAQEDARRQGDQADQLTPALQLDLEILRAMRESRTFLGTPAIAGKLGIEPSDVALRLAALEQAGKIRKNLAGLWEIDRGDQPEADPLDYKARMEAFAQEARSLLADGAVGQDQLVKLLAQRTGQAQSRVREDVLPWLAEQGVIERASARPLQWGLPSGAPEPMLEGAPL